MGLGCYNPFPFSLGGGVEPVEVIHQALNEHHGRVLDVSEGSVADCENYAEALLYHGAWRGNERIAGQNQPAKMLENLPIWEAATGLRPSSQDLPVERRAVLAAKMRGYAGNAPPDISDVCEALMGANFVQVSYVPTGEALTYIPGIFPGPPDCPWFSREAIALVEITKAGLDQDAFDRKVGHLRRELDSLLSMWMAFEVYVHDTNDADETGFVLDYSLLDEAGL